MKIRIIDGIIRLAGAFIRVYAKNWRHCPTITVTDAEFSISRQQPAFTVAQGGPVFHGTLQPMTLDALPVMPVMTVHESNAMAAGARTLIFTARLTCH